MADVAVRTATLDDDVAALSRTLARAFQDDPAFSWATGDADRRRRHAPRYFELMLRRIYLPKGQTHMTDDGSAAALWAPPDKWKVSTAATVPLFPVMARACGRNLGRAMQMLNLMESKHKQLVEPHYYLAFVGTDPDHQGEGRGTALMAHMLERADAEGRPAYLEATSTGSQALYHRHGFEVLEELQWPGGGPTFARMWRDAR